MAHEIGHNMGSQVQCDNIITAPHTPSARLDAPYTVITAPQRPSIRLYTPYTSLLLLPPIHPVPGYLHYKKHVFTLCIPVNN